MDISCRPKYNTISQHNSYKYQNFFSLTYTKHQKEQHSFNHRYQFHLRQKKIRYKRHYSNKFTLNEFTWQSTRNMEIIPAELDFENS